MVALPDKRTEFRCTGRDSRFEIPFELNVAARPGHTRHTVIRLMRVALRVWCKTGCRTDDYVDSVAILE